MATDNKTWSVLIIQITSWWKFPPPTLHAHIQATVLVWWLHSAFIYLNNEVIWFQTALGSSHFKSKEKNREINPAHQKIKPYITGKNNMQRLSHLVTQILSEHHQGVNSWIFEGGSISKDRYWGQNRHASSITVDDII